MAAHNQLTLVIDVFARYSFSFIKNTMASNLTAIVKLWLNRNKALTQDTGMELTQVLDWLI